MTSPGNQHCANCIGTLSFPNSARASSHCVRRMTSQRVGLWTPLFVPTDRPIVTLTFLCTEPFSYYSGQPSRWKLRFSITEIWIILTRPWSVVHSTWTELNKSTQLLHAQSNARRTELHLLRHDWLQTQRTRSHSLQTAAVRAMWTRLNFHCCSETQTHTHTHTHTHTRVTLSASSIISNQSTGSDVLRLGR